jgi:hypothetical protein
MLAWFPGPVVVVVRLWCWIDMQHGNTDRWDLNCLDTLGHYQGQRGPWILDPLHLRFQTTHYWCGLLPLYSITDCLILHTILFIFPRKGLWWLAQELFSYNWALFLRLPLFFSSFFFLRIQLLIHVQHHNSIWLQQCSFPSSVYPALWLSLREASLFSCSYP